MVFDKPVRITKPGRQPLLVRDGTRLRPTEAENSIPRNGHTALAFAMTCRQAYLESIQVYYSANTFSITIRRYLAGFLTTIEQGHLDMINKLQITDPGDKDFAAIRRLRNIETLEIVGLRIHLWWLPHAKFKVKKHLWDFCARSKKLKSFSINFDSVHGGVSPRWRHEYAKTAKAMEEKVNTYIRRRSGEEVTNEHSGYET